MPAATIAISKNRVIAFSRTARADRLRNCFAVSFFSDICCSLIEFLPCSLRARVRRREGDERPAQPPVVPGVGPH